MNIFCPISIHGGRHNIQYCKMLVRRIQQHGHTVLNAIVIDDDVVEKEAQKPPRQIHDQCKQWIDAAEIIIGEVTTPSLGVGMELEYCLAKNILIYALYVSHYEQTFSLMVKGNPHMHLQPYTNATELKAIVDAILSSHT
ncbi:MAG: nucleoside 2-deoxyribosyltransferase [Patescibacteria group bacterium]|nr:nucleoside 2-deoxyribosyltransferase [Patescibacteria group bacterium]